MRFTNEFPASAKSALLKWGDASVEDLFTDSGGSAVVVKRIQVLNICSPRLQNVLDGVQSRHGEASQRRDRQDQIRHGGVQDQVSYQIASFYSIHRKCTILLRADVLDHVMYRMGILAALRSKLKKGKKV